VNIGDAARIPEVIGRFRIEAVLGRGAMGVIYKAHDPVLDRPVAVKLVRADLLDGNERADYLERFRREAQAAGRCVHPNVVAVYDFELHEGNPFIAMEFVEGESLARKLAGGARFPSAEAARVIGQVLDALDCAHRMGIVHRDVKPANILLPPDGPLKVTDFGISLLAGSELTQIGSVVGTPSYMSPEQCRGEPVDARSDLFSAGAVLHEMLAGERPFKGRNYAEIVQLVLNDPPGDLTPYLTPEAIGLKGVVERALAKRPKERFVSARAMRRALDIAMRGATEPEGTVMAPAPAVPIPAPIGTLPFDPALIIALESSLARLVGPIARVLLRQAAREARSPEALCAAVAASLDPSVRAEFMRAAAGRLATGTQVSKADFGTSSPGTERVGATQPSPAVTFVGPAEVERAIRALTRHVGPIARVLVRRALQAAKSRQEFVNELAGHIETVRDRAAFLREMS
jgi:eukaryotic-like serine/threonine-protein kinase